MHRFTHFYLNKTLTEMYYNIYLPYNPIEEMAVSRTKTSKGRTVKFDEHDQKFVDDVYAQVLDEYKKRKGSKLDDSKNPTLAAGHKILMARYQLLGDATTLRPFPEQGDDEKNKPFAWIEKKIENPEGTMTVTLAFPSPGRQGTRPDQRYRATVVTDIKQLKEKLQAAGYGPENMSSITRRSLSTWIKSVVTDKDAPVLSSKIYKVMSGFSPDYHVTQEAEAEDFNKRFATDDDFKDTIGKEATRVVAGVMGFKVVHNGGISYDILNTTGRRLPSLSEPDFDDAFQAAIQYLSNQSATEPQWLNDSNWRKSKLKTGAMNALTDLRRKRDLPGFGGESGGAEDSATGAKTKNIKSGENIPDKADEPGMEPEDDMVAPKNDFDPTSDQDVERIDILGMDDDEHKKYVLKKKAEREATARSQSKQITLSQRIMDRLARSKPKIDKEEPVVSGDFASFGRSDDDDAAGEELDRGSSFRRGRVGAMESRKYSFQAFLDRRLQEVGGATGIVFDRNKKEEPDWQYEGDPDSMIGPSKPRRKVKRGS